jgi:Lrp/AsnC family leucine-responsive transcriptional regulator
MPSQSRTRRQIASKAMHPLLDKVNIRILEQLSTKPRMPMTQLARRVKMSPPSVTERVQRLEEAGVIAGYRMEVNPKALGLPIAAYVRIRPIPGQLAKVIEVAQETAEVVECHRITGEDCFLLKVHAAAVDQLEKVLDKFVLFGNTTTSIVQSSPVPLRGLPLPSA